MSPKSSVFQSEQSQFPQPFKLKIPNPLSLWIYIFFQHTWSMTLGKGGQRGNLFDLQRSRCCHFGRHPLIKCQIQAALYEGWIQMPPSQLCGCAARPHQLLFLMVSVEVEHAGRIQEGGEMQQWRCKLARTKAWEEQEEEHSLDSWEEHHHHLCSLWILLIPWAATRSLVYMDMPEAGPVARKEGWNPTVPYIQFKT